MSNNYENQLDDIRIELYEKTKDMSDAEVVANTNKTAMKIAKQYGINLVKIDPEKFPKAQ